jgi:lipopolysaccharide/colanic/teichoic acid biosynthesis glycosyltransferase
MSRTLTFILALLATLVLFPLLLLVAVLIKLSMPGPVLFRQIRIGQHGKKFLIYKFRSMKVNAEDISITLEHDERITPLGRFLRSSKIDELPQLVNILKGEMAIVGPRPDVPGYADCLEGENRMILSVRPGLTGADSVAYPDEEKLLAKQENPEEYYNRVLYPAKVALNISYVKSRSCWGDWKIIFRTIGVIVKSKSRRV